MAGEDPVASAYLREVAEIANALSGELLEDMARRLSAVRAREGRVFALGVGGGAAHASHAVCDLRKLCDIEAYAPTDNVAELSARTNDDGWRTTFVEWLRTSRLRQADAVVVFSVGGGSETHDVSTNLVDALRFTREVGATILGIVGRSDGATAELADVVIVIPAPLQRLTPHVEGFQSIIAHFLVSHPLLARGTPRW